MDTSDETGCLGPRPHDKDQTCLCLTFFFCVLIVFKIVVFRITIFNVLRIIKKVNFSGFSIDQISKTFTPLTQRPIVS